MMGGFLLASAMTKTKLDADLVRITMKVCGTDPKRVLFGLMMVTMVLSMLISNTATTAMVIAALMPVLSKLGKDSKTAKALVLGIPIAASTGGMGTIIGSPPNAVAAGILAEAGSPIGFLRWIVYGLPIAVFLTLLAWKVLVRVYMKEAGPLSLERSAGGRDDRAGLPGQADDRPRHRAGHGLALADEPAPPSGRRGGSGRSARLPYDEPGS